MKKTRVAPSVTPTPAPAIDAPSDWSLQTPWGVQAFDDAPGGRLVRIAALVKWARACGAGRCVAVADAVEFIAEGLTRSPGVQLYELHPTERASAVPAGERFGIGQPRQSMSQRLAGGDISAPAPASQVGVRITQLDEAPAEPDPGSAPAALACRLRRLTDFWRELLLHDAPNRRTSVRPEWRLAVSLADAYRLWGYGTAAGVEAVSPGEFNGSMWTDVVAHRKPGRVPWTDGNQLKLAKDEFERRGGGKAGQRTKVLEAMAEELGTSSVALSKALFGERKRKNDIERDVSAGRRAA